MKVKLALLAAGVFVVSTLSVGNASAADCGKKTLNSSFSSTSFAIETGGKGQLSCAEAIKIADQFLKDAKSRYGWACSYSSQSNGDPGTQTVFSCKPSYRIVKRWRRNHDRRLGSTIKVTGDVVPASTPTSETPQQTETPPPTT